MVHFKIFDKDGSPIEHHDLQDKTVWCKSGFKTEEVFISLYGKELGLVINPQKVYDPFAPDLLDLASDTLGDLKVQNTPFFKSRDKFGIDPRFAVVFNHKDRVRYIKKYPKISIYYWIDWVAVGFEMGSLKIKIEPLKGVWKISMTDLERLLSESHLHEYQQRINDTRGNARDSYVLDIRNENFIQLI